MNYAIFMDYVRGVEADLSQRFGVPREAAAEIAHYMEVAAIAAEAEERKASQLLLELRTVGTHVAAQRRGITDRAIRKQRMSVLQRRRGTKIDADRVV